MRGISLFLLLLSLSIFQNCGVDDIQLPENDLEGKIEGAAWVYGTANAYRRTTDGQYEASFISIEESPSNPCGLPSPGRPHVKAIFRPDFGNFAVSPIAIDDNQVQVIFQVSNARALTANSGFLEVFDIRGNTVFGYLQATEDINSNFVEGRVEIELCDL